MRLADRISLAPTPADVSRFNAWFDEKCTRAGMARTLAADLKLCVNEVLANAISYGFREISHPWITVRVQLDKARAIATIVDNGTYFDLRNWQVQKDRDLMTGEPGGFGIALIKERAKHIHYSRFCGRNHLRITCELPAP